MWAYLHSPHSPPPSSSLYPNLFLSVSHTNTLSHTLTQKYFLSNTHTFSPLQPFRLESEKWNTSSAKTFQQLHTSTKILNISPKLILSHLNWDEMPRFESLSSERKYCGIQNKIYLPRSRLTFSIVVLLLSSGCLY